MHAFLSNMNWFISTCLLKNNLKYVLHTDTIRHSTYHILTCRDCKYPVLKSSIGYVLFHIWLYLHVFCRQFLLPTVPYLTVFVCILSVVLLQIHAHTYLHRAVASRYGSCARRRAVAAHSPRCSCCKFVARAAQAQAKNQQMYLDQVR